MDEGLAQHADLLLGARLTERLGLTEVGLGLLEALADVGRRRGVALGEVVEGADGVEGALVQAVGAQAEILKSTGVGVRARDGGQRCQGGALGVIVGPAQAIDVLRQTRHLASMGALRI